MPTYQYKCTDCGTPLEAVQSFSDDALTTCPTCGGKLRKVFSAVGVVFKGSGFYRTDSRESGKVKTTAASDTASDKGTSAGESGKGADAVKNGSSPAGESKPATTSDSSSASKTPAAAAGGSSTTPAKRPGSSTSSAA